MEYKKYKNATEVVFCGRNCAAKQVCGTRRWTWTTDVNKIFSSSGIQVLFYGASSAIADWVCGPHFLELRSHFSLVPLGLLLSTFAWWRIVLLFVALVCGPHFWGFPKSSLFAPFIPRFSDFLYFLLLLCFQGSFTFLWAAKLGRRFWKMIPPSILTRIKFEQ